MRQYQANVFQALGHPTRVAIVESLNCEEMSVGQLCVKIGVMQSNASQHLAVLRNKHVVRTRKDGNQIFYSLRDPALGKVLQTLDTIFLAQLTRARKTSRQERKASARSATGRPAADGGSKHEGDR
jgi:ArsR family transcriptional regulator